MKLLTEMSGNDDDAILVFNGDIDVPVDDQLEHDAAAAHALMMAMDEVGAENRDYSWLACVEKIDHRASELMAQWGFDSGEDA